MMKMGATSDKMTHQRCHVDLCLSYHRFCNARCRWCNRL